MNSLLKCLYIFFIFFGVLGDGFNGFLCSPQELGKIPILSNKFQNCQPTPCLITVYDLGRGKYLETSAIDSD